MKNCILFSILLTVFTFVFSVSAKQEKFIKHTVLKGETINIISQKYKVTPYDIYKLNPDSQNGIELNSILLIPSSSLGNQPIKQQNVISRTKEITHLVQPKETFYSVSKKYGVSVDAIKAVNPDLVNSDLKIGQLIVIPSTLASKENIASLPIENPNLTSKETSKPVLKNEKKYVLPKVNVTYHVIEPKETKYSISRKYNMTIQELELLNPQIKNDFPIGFKLIVSENPVEAVSTKTDKIIQKTEHGNLLKSLNTKSKKNLALLLPFNITKIESDTVNSTQARLKKDKFLNLTLDFYSGALMAIDSARVLGMNVDIKILDSQETKNSSNATALVQQNNLSAMDVIIGPFYQTNVEKLAELVEPTKTPVISPLSKDDGKKYTNLYQSMPSNDLLRNSIFEYMRNKGGNIIAVIDSKKGSVKQFILENQKDTKIVGLSIKNNFVADSLKIHLQKDKMNYVVLASESTGMILSTTNAMLNAQKEFQIQLVILEQNETLDFEEISLNRLTKLKLLYPSLSRPNSTIEANQFDRKYKKINKILPSQFAIRGFDLTFDTLIRLSQDKTFEETIQSTATEQIENKFDYVQNTTYGYSNNGIYILYYDTDLTIKEAL